MCGGSSASTDRKLQLREQTNLDSLATLLQGKGTAATDKGAAVLDKGLATTDTGLGDTAKASKYYSDILSGDPSKVMAAAAPEISAITGSADQQKKEAANFGNRTGGTNAAMQDLNTKTRGQVADVIAKAKPGAAAGLERTGAETSGVGLGKSNVGLGVSGQGLEALGMSSQDFSNLISDAIASRQVSQKIHSDAVAQWKQLIEQVVAAGAGGAGGGAGAGAGAGAGINYGGVII